MLLLAAVVVLGTVVEAPPERPATVAVAVAPARGWRPSLFHLSIAANLGDAASTRWALANGAHESNPVAAPFARSTAGLVAFKLAGVAAWELGARLAEKQRGGKPIAKALRIAAIVGPAVCTVVNVRNAARR